MVASLASPRKSHRQPTVNLWLVLTLALVGVFFAPVLAIFVAAWGDSGGLWAHLFSTVLPRYVGNTLVLMIGVGLVSLIFGVSTAWVVFRFDFPARRILEWMLLLPAAVPAYLVAYALTDFLEFAGPLQSALRGAFGWQSARDYWFPEIRSMEGAVLVMGAVLYPYVYMMARTAFVLTPSSLFEVAMMHKASLFRMVAVPLARPAIVAGLALVLMETISDFGTVEYFAIETLTLGIFNVWLGMNSLPAAAQIAVLCFLFIIALLIVEQLARARRRYKDTTKGSVTLPRKHARGWQAVACMAVCLLPVTIGFMLPVGVLLSFVLSGYSTQVDTAMIAAALNSLLLASTVAFAIMATAAFMAFVVRFQGGLFIKEATQLASVGYAFPGTVLAIGVVTAGGAVDAGVSYLLDRFAGVSFEGWLTGSIGLVILACVVRFQAIGYGAVTTGLDRLSPNMMHASRTLGLGLGASLRTVILPLLQKSLLAGGLLVFVDVMKELPMTLLLRPFNFETLATYVYQFAKDELLEEAALPALAIVATGVLPVIVMNTALARMSR